MSEDTMRIDRHMPGTRLYRLVTQKVTECVCSIESGPCERVESLQMSGRF